MIIIELTEQEMDFAVKSSEQTGAYKVRTFDIDTKSCVFVYYFDEYIHLTIRRYAKEQTSMKDWEELRSARMIYPDIDLSETIHIHFDIEENKIHVQLPHTAVNERNW